MLEVSEAHTPEMRASVRVSDAGTVMLTLAGEVHIGGMDETAAAHAIETALIDRGMLLHPQVTVLGHCVCGTGRIGTWRGCAARVYTATRFIIACSI